MVDVLIEESQTVGKPLLQNGDFLLVAAHTVGSKHGEGIEIEVATCKHPEATTKTTSETASKAATEATHRGLRTVHLLRSAHRRLRSVCLLLPILVYKQFGIGLEMMVFDLF